MNIDMIHGTFKYSLLLQQTLSPEPERGIKRVCEELNISQIYLKHASIEKVVITKHTISWFDSCLEFDGIMF